MDGGRLTITDPEMFVSDTRKLLRLFWLANERDLDIHPEAMTAARRSLWALTRQARIRRRFPRDVPRYRRRARTIRTASCR
jgi:UTP:GlnB (protein PII) uridylyltransferase